MRESWVPGDRLPSGGVRVGEGVDSEVGRPGGGDEGIVMEGKGELGMFFNRRLLLPPLEMVPVGVATDDLGRELVCREEVEVREGGAAEGGRELVCREEVEVREGGAAEGGRELVCREERVGGAADGGRELVCREEVEVREGGAAEVGRELVCREDII